MQSASGDGDGHCKGFPRLVCSTAGAKLGVAPRQLMAAPRVQRGSEGASRLFPKGLKSQIPVRSKSFPSHRDFSIHQRTGFDLFQHFQSCFVSVALKPFSALTQFFSIPDSSAEWQRESEPTLSLKLSALEGCHGLKSPKEKQEEHTRMQTWSENNGDFQFDPELA